MKRINATKVQNLEVLRQLCEMLRCSFARYLLYARPWSRSPYTLLMALTRMLAHAHQHYADEIARLLASRGQVVSSPTFPSEFTYYNDVSLEHLATEILRHQRVLIGAATAASGVLAADGEISHILKKLLASLRKYADLLEELLSRQRKKPSGATERARKNPVDLPAMNGSRSATRGLRKSRHRRRSPRLIRPN